MPDPLLYEAITKRRPADTHFRWRAAGWEGHEVKEEAESGWQITERTVEVAQSRAEMWLSFAVRALERTRASGPVPWGLVTESWSCVLALNHVRSCAALATETATVPAALETASVALAAFDRAVPGLINARNFLEHDEAYVVGKGDLQQRGPRSKRIVDQSAAAEWTFDPRYRDNDRDQPVVNIGPTLSIDLTAAVDHARTLRRALYLAASQQGLTSTAPDIVESSVQGDVPTRPQPGSAPQIL